MKFYEATAVSTATGETVTSARFAAMDIANAQHMASNIFAQKLPGGFTNVIVTEVTP